MILMQSRDPHDKRCRCGDHAIVVASHYRKSVGTNSGSLV